MTLQMNKIKLNVETIPRLLIIVTETLHKKHKMLVIKKPQGLRDVVEDVQLTDRQLGLVHRLSYVSLSISLQPTCMVLNSVLHADILTQNSSMST